VFFFLALLAVPGFAQSVPGDVLSAAPGRAPAEAPDPLRLVSSSAAGVELELSIGGVTLEPGPDGAAVTAPGLDPIALPGQPDLPGRVVLVGIPQQGDVQLTVSSSGPEELAGVDVRPGPAFGAEVRRLESVYDDDRFWPGPLAELVGIETFRGVRAARVRLNPVQYSPLRRTLLVHRQLTVTVRFAGRGQSTGGDGFDPVLERLLVNGALAKSWRSGPGLDQDSVNFFDRASVWCKVRTESTGVYRITPADLERAGLEVSGIDPTTLRLYAMVDHQVNGPYPDTMDEIPVYVQGEDDAKFTGSDYLAFYAESPSCWVRDTAGTRTWRSNPFTDFRCFWLTWGTGPGRRMETTSGAGAAAPATTAPYRCRIEPERLCPARSGLLWLWDELYKQAGLAATTHQVGLDLPGRDEWQRLSLRFYGRTATNRLRIQLNGVELDSFIFLGSPSSPRAADVSFDGLPGAVNAAGSDTLTFELYGDDETEVYLDYAEALYTRELEVSAGEPVLLFHEDGDGYVEFGVAGATGDALLLDVTDPWRPRRIVDTDVSGGRRNARVQVSGEAVYACGLVPNLPAPVSLERREPGLLRDETEHVNYYIICPDEFFAAGRMLARYRDGNIAGIAGARAQAVRLSAIYDEYGFGMEEPGAIKAFLRSRAPEYGLLAGDATYDYKNNLEVERPPGVPAYEVGYDIDPEVYGAVAKSIDAWYADFDGEGASPDMILGRVTCRGSDELRLFLEKVRTYETQPFGFWAKRLLLLADDEWLGEPVMNKLDPIRFAHITSCETMVAYTRDRLDPVKVYLTEYAYTGVNDKAAARAELLERLNQGALLWFFFGHGAGFQLCHERALHIDGVPGVVNGSRNPFAFFGSCGVGRFEDNRYQAVAEELVRKQSGCIATMGASKATTPGGNDQFARIVIEALFDRPDLPIGPAFYEAWATSNSLYHLFGDPATRLRLPPQGIEPTIAPDTLHPGALVQAVDSVPLEQGLYGVSVHEADWFRTYRSDAGSRTYYLPGYEIHSAPGTFDAGNVHLAFVVPKIDYPDTVVVPDGSYERVANSSSVSLLCWSGTEGYASRLAGIPFGDPVETADSAPPAQRMLADGIPLSTSDTVRVPRDFTLAGTLEDESGILLASAPGYGLSLYIGAGAGDRVDLTGRFSYDQNSITRGQFSYPVTLGLENDSVTVIASDNMRNRCICTYYVETTLSDALVIENCLVYPNPTPGAAHFTFELSRPAFVTVKVFTISGRLVRVLPTAVGGFGYNQVAWDGRDTDGRELANGVYLYKVDAKSMETSSSFSSSASYRDKLIIQR